VAARFARAAGLTAVCDALRGARELRASDFVGWPVTWLVQRLTGRGALRKARLSRLWDDLRAVSTDPAGAQQAEIDNALTEFGDSLAADLPRPWQDTVRSAARSRGDAIPAAVGTAIGNSLPAEDEVLWWWRLAGAWQGLLLGISAIAIAWMILITVFGVLHAGSGAPALFTATWRLPWIGLCAVVALSLGASTASTCMAIVKQNADRENADVAADAKERIAVVAKEMVIIPAQQELSEFARFRDELRLARRPSAADEAS
jgi:hypothetical protein